jgi:hypothetical protein
MLLPVWLMLVRWVRIVGVVWTLLGWRWMLDRLMMSGWGGGKSIGGFLSFVGRLFDWGLVTRAGV